jgi:hypothetical protein
MSIKYCIFSYNDLKVITISPPYSDVSPSGSMTPRSSQMKVQIVLSVGKERLGACLRSSFVIGLVHLFCHLQNNLI